MAMRETGGVERKSMSEKRMCQGMLTAEAEVEATEAIGVVIRVVGDVPMFECVSGLWEEIDQRMG